jgi:hypothetical protein
VREHTFFTDIIAFHMVIYLKDWADESAGLGMNSNRKYGCSKGTSSCIVTAAKIGEVIENEQR